MSLQTSPRRWLLALIVAVLGGSAACNLIAYDLTASGRDMPDAGTDAGEKPPGGEDAGNKADAGGAGEDAGETEELDGGDYGYAAHSEPGWPMPDSATTGKCMKVDFLDGGSFEDTCPMPGDRFYGQDPQYERNKPTYDVTTDARVAIDSVTQLMWQRTLDVSRQRSWSEARDYCFKLSLAGLDDWRLPTRVELVSLLDFGRLQGSMIEATAFPNTPGARFWTLSPFGESEAWYVSFDANDVATEGSVEVGIVTHVARTQKGFVRCVR
jgi:hypothetical protein